MVSAPHILIADDREDIHKALRLLLKGRGYKSTSVHHPDQVLAQLKVSSFDALLLDLNYTRDITSGQEGLDVLPKIKDAAPGMPVIVMTAFATIDLAIETLQRGAGDFIEKPWDNQRLLSILDSQLALGRALSGQDLLREENRILREAGGLTMIAKSRAMAPVLELIERIAPTDANVLVTGEHGTGKGVVAQMLHANSARATSSLITVNIGALSDTLFESELFGHVKGAFTDAREARKGRFHLANEGTLFLDEIGNLSLASQAKLLRVIETGEFEAVGSSKTEKADVRIISATNANLPQAARDGRFREDLLFRLNTIEIQLPPLRERGEDILALAFFFLQKHSTRYGRGSLSFTVSAQDALMRHSWPGNVRELDHSVQRGVLMARGDLVADGDLGLASATNAAFNLEDMTLEEVERILIQKALKKSGGNMKAAAEMLGLGRSSLYRRMEKYGMENHGTS